MKFLLATRHSRTGLEDIRDDSAKGAKLLIGGDLRSNFYLLCIEGIKFIRYHRTWDFLLLSIEVDLLFVAHCI
jgi:hypothetical protein